MKLYTKTVCPKCMYVKSQVENIEDLVEFVNIEHDKEAYETLVGAGIMAVPVLEHDGKLIIDPNEIISTIKQV